jgi:hypothetical protein
MGKKVSEEIGMFDGHRQDTMHEPADRKAARIRAERIYMRDFMGRMIEQAESRGDAQGVERQG